MSEKRSGRGGVLAEHLFSTSSSACVTACSRSVSVSIDKCCLTCASQPFGQGRLKTESITKSSHGHPHVSSPHVVLCVLGGTMHSMVLTDSLFRHEHKWYSFLCTYVPGMQMVGHGKRFCVSSATMGIKTELYLYTEYRTWTQISRVHSPVVKGVRTPCWSCDKLTSPRHTTASVFTNLANRVSSSMPSSARPRFHTWIFSWWMLMCACRASSSAMIASTAHNLSGWHTTVTSSR